MWFCIHYLESYLLDSGLPYLILCLRHMKNILKQLKVTDSHIKFWNLGVLQGLHASNG